MIILQCPYCHEQRTEEELTYGGEVGGARPLDPERVNDAVWTDYLFMRTNVKGVLAEQWCCTFGCGQWFKVWRDTVTHELRAIVRFNEPDADGICGVPFGRTASTPDRG
jgi:sarcosine oxidase, subunit delta